MMHHYYRIVTDELEYFIGSYQRDCLLDPPWRQAKYDAFVVLGEAYLDDVTALELADALVTGRNDWIEILGRDSERLHDLIDARSVTLNRQAEIGNGSPMTAWHDAIISAEQLHDYLRTGGLGCQLVKVVLVVSAPKLVLDIVEATKPLSQRLQPK